LFRLGIDVGGTFTDLAILNENTGEIQIAKSPTTPSDFVQGALNCLTKVELDKKQVSYIVHGMTVVTNAIVQRRLASTAIVTTKGFRDVLEIMRQNRPIWGLFDIQWDKPKPLIPRHLRFEIDERIDAKGNVVRALREEDVRKLAKKLKGLRVESLAVSLMFSHLNSSHEERIREIFREEAPEIYVSLSSKVNPQIREYERSSTTAIDAVTKPLAKRYFSSFEKGLRQAGLNSTLLIIKSNGGLIDIKQAGEFPVYTVESGPAGGTIGATYLGELIGQNKLIAIDMGGTTFKVSIVENGVPRTRSEGEIEWGIPYRVPMIDISEIGAGGGSIAWIDREGILRVGPQSAGADPGPVSYGLGGKEPTFTDACLVLGYLNPRYLLGGDMKIDKEAAAKAISKKISEPLHLSTTEAAYGIVEVSNQLMLGSMRVSSVEKGYDPREFATIAYGGAGPVVAAYLARELGSPLLIIPPYPGIFSAIGMLVSDIRLDFMHPFHCRAQRVDLKTAEEIYDKLEQQAIKSFRKDFRLGYKVTRSADMRYVGQNYELNASVPNRKLTERTIRSAEKNFASLHEKTYGHAKGAEVEFVNLRVTLLGFIVKPKLREIPMAESIRQKDRRDVYFGPKHGGFLKTPVYDRAGLGRESTLEGPCIIEETDSTIVVYPKQKATIDRYGNVLIKTN
jgi:N-methylhydantoinase A